MNVFDYPFDSGGIFRRKKALRRQLLELNDASKMTEKRVAVLSGSTIGDIKDILELFLLNFGIKPEFYEGQYSQFYEDIMFENQALTDFKPDIIYIHTSVRNLSDPDFPDKLRAVWEKIKETFSCPIIQNNFELPNYGFDDINAINGLNVEFADYAKENRDFYINDIQHLSARFGLDAWFGDQDYFLYKYALSMKAIPLLCHSIAKIIKSIYGKNQKCLVLDLDNTIWGGAAGDLGVMGIELGMETALGEAYVSFQKYVRTLRDRGIIIAVCSKNDERVAKETFGNPNMVLKLEDITVFCANWESKAENILKIANNLNILPESMVFIDDNPAERELVSCALPEVKIPEVSSAVDFIRYIEMGGYFYTTRVSADDAKRNEYYMADAKRNELKNTFADYGEYLSSLRMTSEIGRFIPAHFDRIAQLINKTNQFNLTTARYSVSEIEKIASNPDFITIYATLDDKFGSNGIVSVLLGEIAEKFLHIRLWVMSCRVFKRDLEFAVFDNLVDSCVKNGVEKIIGYYFKTEKNGYVSNLFDDLGFSRISDDAWEFELRGEYLRRNKYIKTGKDDD